MKKIIIISLIAACLYSCSKEGDLQRKDSYREIFVQNFSLAPDARLVVRVNNELLTDNLVSPGAFRKIIKTATGTQQIQITDYRTGKLLHDTLLPTPGTKFTITLLQLDATGKQKPRLIGGGEEGDNIPEKHVLLGLNYTTADLPDSMAVRIYRLNVDPVTFEFTDIDTLTQFAVIHKGQLSDFKLMDFSRDPYVSAYAFEPRSAVTGEILPGGEIDLANFMMPFLSLNPTTDKHIIANLDAMLMPDNRYSFWSSVLVSY
ncbi:hypothetical protein [Chitinophaga sp. 22620]|uniref:hypothetical protein n=1 Tax=Chitinophaga sp. 22620 TaxID=3453952 RepID=UPI003F877FEB